MAHKISPTNLAYQLRRGQKDLLGDPLPKDDVMESTHRADYKKPPPKEKRPRGKKEELLERFLFEKISDEIVNEVYRPRSPPSYISTTHDHFNVAGFDPDAGLQPTFEYSLYNDVPMTFWSENKGTVHGITCSKNPTRSFPVSTALTKSVLERYDQDL